MAPAWHVAALCVVSEQVLSARMEQIAVPELACERLERRRPWGEEGRDHDPPDQEEPSWNRSGETRVPGTPRSLSVP
jgi:hypothetical protein